MMLKNRSLIFYLIAFVCIQLNAQTSKDWDFLKPLDAPSSYRSDDQGIVVRGDVIHTCYLSRKEDQLLYTYSTDKGKTWKTEVIEDSTASDYDALWGLRRKKNDDSLKMFLKDYRYPLLAYSGTPTGMSLAVDSLGTPHVLFLANYGNDKDGQEKFWLKHAWRENNTWKTEIIKSTTVRMQAFRGYCSALVIDKNNTCHIAFSQNPYELFYGTNKSGRWKIQKMDSSLNVSQLSLAIGSRDQVYFAVNNSGSIVCLWSNDEGGSWQSVQMERPVFLREPFIALDKYDHPHLVYTGSNEKIFHTWINTAGSWQTSEVPGGTRQTARPRILIDNCNGVHILFYPVYTVLRAL